MLATWVTAGHSAERLDPAFYEPRFVRADIRVRASSNGQTFDTVRERARPIVYGVIKPVPTESGPAMIRNLDFAPPGINTEQVLRISQEQNESFRRSVLKPGDLLVTIGGYVGTAAIVPPSLSGGNINQHIARVAVDGAKSDPYFLWAFVRCSHGTRLLERWVSGTAQPGINLGDLRRIPVPHPARDIQRAIGNKLRKAERLRELSAAARRSSDARIDEMMRFGVAKRAFSSHGWRTRNAVGPLRLDAWFHRPEYVWRADRLAARAGLHSVSNVCKLISKSASVATWPNETFDYFEIGGIDPTTGEATATVTAKAEAPSRAKYLVQAGDVLVSTVRPNLRKVGQIDPDRNRPGVATSGFSVWRAPTVEHGAYVRACLMHEVGVEQLMRWNTGGTYPAIDIDVPGRALIPYEPEIATEIGEILLAALSGVREARRLVTQATDAVEALIDSTLDEATLLAESAAIEQWLAENPSPTKEA